MNKKYFKLLVTNSYRSTIFMIIIGVLIYPLVIAVSNYKPATEFQIARTPQIGLVVAFLAILCYIVPVMKNAYLMNKKTIDCYYSLPIKRRAILNLNWVVGFLQIFVSYTLVFFLGFIIMLLKEQNFSMIYYIPLYFSTIFLGLFVYSFNYFVTSRANSIVDSIIFLLIYTFIFAIVSMPLDSICDGIFHIKYLNSSFDLINVITFVGFINISDCFKDLICNFEPAGLDVNFYLSIGINIVLGIAGFGLLNLFITKDKAERSEQISSSWFGYKLLLPIAFCFSSIEFLLFTLNAASAIIFFLLIVAFLIGYIIYYRKFIFPKKAYIVIGCCIVGTIMTVFILGIIFRFLI